MPPVRRVLLVAGAIIGLWFVVALVMVGLSALAARDGAQQVDNVRGALSVEGALRGDGRSELRAASDAMHRSVSLVSNPLVAPLRVLPVIGRQVRSLDALATTSATLLDDGVDALDTASVAAEAMADPAARIAALTSLHSSAARLATAVDEADLGPRDGLVGPLAEARHRLDSALNDLSQGLASAEAVTAGLVQFLDGGEHLLLIANNAEMRAGQGMALSQADLRTDGGRLVLGEVIPVAEDNLEAGSVPMTPVSEELVANWGWLQPLNDWRNLGVSPRFDVTGPVAAQMWKAKTGRDVKTVLLVDVETMRAVLAATGPITVGERTVNADNLIFELLVQQYFTTDVDDRRNALDEIARAAFDALESGRWDLVTLARGLQAAAAGRHVLAWSADPILQAGWDAAGVAGLLDSNSLLVGTVNRGGNKLDPFITVDVVTTVDGDRLRAEITITNETPEGLSRYAGGPHPNSDATYGEYLGVLAISVPGAATDIGFVGGERLVVDGRDGPSHVVGRWFQLARGARSVFTLELTVAGGADAVTVMPSARIPPQKWQVGRIVTTDAAPLALRG